MEIKEENLQSHISASIKCAMIYFTYDLLMISMEVFTHALESSSDQITDATSTRHQRLLVNLCVHYIVDMSEQVSEGRPGVPYVWRGKKVGDGYPQLSKFQLVHDRSYGDPLVDRQTPLRTLPSLAGGKISNSLLNTAISA